MTTHTEGTERRRDTRVPSLNPVNLWQEGELYPGRTLDLSRSGAQVELATPLRAAERPAVSLRLCLGERVVPVKGQVVWVHRRQEGHWAHGIEFERLSPQPSRWIAEHLVGAV